MDKAEANKFAKLLTAGGAKPDEVPKGWHTAAEIATQIGRSQPHTSKLLRTGVADGSVERRDYRIRTGNRLYPVGHYKLR